MGDSLAAFCSPSRKCGQLGEQAVRLFEFVVKKPGVAETGSFASPSRGVPASAPPGQCNLTSAFDPPFYEALLDGVLYNRLQRRISIFLCLKKRGPDVSVILI